MEAVIARCSESAEARAAESFLAVLRRPYDELPATRAYQDPPPDGDKNYRTFCGT